MLMKGLLYDAILGDKTLFTRGDEVLTSWKTLEPLLQYVESKKDDNFPNYEAGSWGPNCADNLIEKDQRQWRFL